MGNSLYGYCTIIVMSYYVKINNISATSYTTKYNQLKCIEKCKQKMNQTV